MSDDDSAIEPEEEKHEPQRSLAELLQRADASQQGQRSQNAGQPAVDIPSLHLGSNQLDSDRYVLKPDEEPDLQDVAEAEEGKAADFVEKVPEDAVRNFESGLSSEPAIDGVEVRLNPDDAAPGAFNPGGTLDVNSSETGIDQGIAEASKATTDHDRTWINAISETDVEVPVNDHDNGDSDPPAEEPTSNPGPIDSGPHAPTASNDEASTAENAPITIDVLGNDRDVDVGDRLEISSVRLKDGQGAVSVSDGMLVYDPGSAYDHLAVGEHSIVTVIYEVADRTGLTDRAEVTLTVTGSNDGPVVSSSLADQSASEDAAFSYTVPASSFSDADMSDTLNYRN